MKEKILVDAVFAAVRKEITNAVNVGKMLDKASKSKSHLEKLSQLKKDIGDAKARLKRNSVLKNRLFETFGDGLITEQEFKEQKQHYVDEAAALQSRIDGFIQENTHLSTAYSKDKGRISDFLNFKNQTSPTRGMLVELIEKVIVHGQDRIEIVWKYGDEYEAACGIAEAYADGMATSRKVGGQ